MNNTKVRQKRKRKLFIISNFLKTANIIILMRKKNHNLQNFISVVEEKGQKRGKGGGEQKFSECLTLIKLFFTNNYQRTREKEK